MPSRILVPMIVACALFMENMDSTVLATSLPAIARDLNEDPIALKLALTSYLLSLAVFIPASGWVADRFGAKTVFRLALVIFMTGSATCGFASGLGDFVVSRIVQGIGGAMMVPVGRLVILRSVPKDQLVSALAWFTIPAMIGPIAGPPLGGFITTYFDWRWIFYINIPIGLLGLVLVTRYIEDIREVQTAPLDWRGLILLGVGLSGLVFGLAVIGQSLVPFWLAVGMVAVGLVFCGLYWRHAAHTAHPLLNLGLMRLPTFRASVIGGSTFRVGIGATAFLLPLLFQIGFGLSAFASGLLTFVSAVGAFAMKFAAPPILKRFGFRQVLLANAIIGSSFVAVCALFTPATPHVIILAVLLAGGFFRSLQFTAVNSLAFADVAAPSMSQATSFSSAAQQLSISLGVAVAALALEAGQVIRGDFEIRSADFVVAFVVVGAIGALSALSFRTLSPDAGAELTGRLTVAADEQPSSQPPQPTPTSTPGQ
ncbi:MULTISPECIES: MFS transporter [Rhodomicrobium]|uniref:MFS transporter n=1 Tax=Rhodomicrobium TaxID=1068 RepID=UPI000B4AFBA7|nr:MULTISPECIES: MFS transporter [Rhodomicrobium]